MYSMELAIHKYFICVLPHVKYESHGSIFPHKFGIYRIWESLQFRGWTSGIRMTYLTQRLNCPWTACQLEHDLSVRELRIAQHHLTYLWSHYCYRLRGGFHNVWWTNELSEKKINVWICRVVQNDTLWNLTPYFPRCDVCVMYVHNTWKKKKIVCCTRSSQKPQLDPNKEIIAPAFLWLHMAAMTVYWR